MIVIQDQAPAGDLDRVLAKRLGLYSAVMRALHSMKISEVGFLLGYSVTDILRQENLSTGKQESIRLAILKSFQQGISSD